MIHMIHMYYSAKYPIVTWPKENMEAANIKTQKLLTMYRDFHHKYNTQKLYISQKEDLVNVKTTVLNETQIIQEYIKKMEPKYYMLRGYLRQQQSWEEDKAGEVPWQDKSLHGIYHW